ncbi:ankyrin repeats (3 copies) domain-containing protein [Pochonia chlamydosporia 170]|uniref:Ankyrin repeats (3 copies) domain-containing protein n=1 Tax=Pochonia chlamydosporia 170 TaxID=1380566 RepID=A0A179FA60_METCM|nr:ankyrin repeats (3 copies) domain-containing protein [Pochonia chlamydosporia 170]OAQ62171.1 ankyrin repeats (3 copies) domain-containing protein [Pochonia chlamydosporia 170]
MGFNHGTRASDSNLESTPRSNTGSLTGPSNGKSALTNPAGHVELSGSGDGHATEDKLPTLLELLGDSSHSRNRSHGPCSPRFCLTNYLGNLVSELETPNSWEDFSAMMTGQKETLEAHVKCGFDINHIENPAQQHPLDHASRLGLSEVVRALLHAMTKASSPSWEEHEALKIASQLGHDGIARAFVEYGISKGATAEAWNDCLRVAVQNRHIEVVKLLIEAKKGLLEKERQSMLMEKACELSETNPQDQNGLADLMSLFSKNSKIKSLPWTTAAANGTKAILCLLSDTGSAESPNF